MNPYEPTKAALQEAPAKLPVVARPPVQSRGRPCPFCQSINTHEDGLLHTRPNIFYVMFFGWLFLLARAAFTKRTDRCEDCGELNSYYSTGSRLALVFFLLLVLLITMELSVHE